MTGFSHPEKTAENEGAGLKLCRKQGTTYHRQTKIRLSKIQMFR